MSNNFVESVEDFEHLADLLELSVLDLSNNHIEDPLIIEVLTRMPSLRVLNLMGNPVLRKIPAYRKTMILACVSKLFSSPQTQKYRRFVRFSEKPAVPGRQACIS